jgi:hypothetical protein
MPIDEVRQWAAGQPGFEEIWIDRDHLGWITVAFSTDVDARQRELQERFPDVGAVVVAVDRPIAELHALQERVHEELAPFIDVSSGIDVTRWVVGIGIGVLDAERIAAVEERFAGEPICVEGADPAEVPSAGPQRGAADGWRLLASESGVGEPYRTGIAFDEASYAELWRAIGLPDDRRPAVDFDAEVAIWFGAVFGSGCEDLRLDDVVTDHDRALVHAEIVLGGWPLGCNDDANPHAFVVAVERSHLPSGPFAIQLDAHGPPGGAPEERTVVDVDLSPAGAVAAPGQVHGDPALANPGPAVLESGDFVEPGFPFQYRLYVHCGIEWLGMLNDVAWRTEVPAGQLDHIPDAWRPAVGGDQTIELTITLETDPEPVISAVADGHEVIYRPTVSRPPGCD